MYRVMFCAAAAVLVAGVQLAMAAGDFVMCAQTEATGDEGIAACTRRLALNPNDSYAYYYRGIGYNGKGDYDRAISDFDQAIRLHPDASAYGGRGNAYYGKGDYGRAISDFDQATRLDPKFARAYAIRGEAYEAKSDPDHAIADFDQALKLDPSLREAQRGRERVQALLAKRSNPGTQTSAPVAAVEPATADDASVCADYRRGDEAIAACSRLLALNPKDAGICNNRGLAYARRGDNDRAISDYDQAIRLDPKFTVAYSNRAKAYSAKGDFGRAISDYDQVSALAGTRGIDNNKFGFAYLRSGDYDRAISEYDQAIRLNPQYAHAYGGRGEAYFRKGDYERAIFDYDQAIRLDPNYVDAYNRRGEAYEAKNDPDHAIADFDQALKVDPSLADARRGRERVQVLLAKRSNPGTQTSTPVAAVQPATADDTSVCTQATGDDAIAACTRILALDPKNAYAYYGRGDAYLRKGDYDRAISDFDQAIQLDPRNAVAYSNRGRAYYGKSAVDRALSDYDKAIRLDPKYAFAYANRGDAYYNKGDYDRAIADYDQVIRLDPKLAPKYAFAYNGRGKVYFGKGDYDRAIDDYDEAIRLDPKYALAYDNRGEAYEAKNDPDHAIADFNQALKLIPLFSAAQQGRERVQALLAKRSNPGARANPPTSAAAPVAVASPGRRIALVIGMSAYANVTPLRNPTSDARAIADAFHRLGFAEVIEREDLTRAKLEEALKDFGDKAADADWAVIYYAGHGVEMNGENYLVPVDAKLARADHVEDETVTLKRVLSKAEAAHKLRMVILDACRNSPFRMASADGRSRAIGRGLSPVEPAGGVLVAFAARGGTIADDGSGEHSPFTQALLANLETPDLEINVMFRKVRDQVLARTNNAQEPFTYGSLPGEELYFKQAVAR